MFAFCVATVFVSNKMAVDAVNLALASAHGEGNPSIIRSNLWKDQKSIHNLPSVKQSFSRLENAIHDGVEKTTETLKSILREHPDTSGTFKKNNVAIFFQNASIDLINN